jgi:hypothetical protein
LLEVAKQAGIATATVKVHRPAFRLALLAQK